MRTRAFLLCIGLLLVTSVTAATAQVSAKPAGGTTTAALFDRMADALGGRARLERVATRHERSTLEVGGLAGTAEMWSTAKGQTHTEYDLAGVDKGVSVFDGQKAWSRDANGKVRELAGPELAGEVTSAYLESYSHLLPGRMKGTAEIAGEDAGQVRVRITPSGGKPVTLTVDKSTWLVAKTEVATGDLTSTTTFGDWRDVDGVKVAFSARQTTGDPKYDVVLKTLAAQFDIPVDSAKFEAPAESGAVAAFAAGASALNIPFELNSNHIYVQAKLNGAGPLAFLLDSGAEMSVVDMARAKALGIALKGSFEARGAGEGSVEAAAVTDATLSVQGAEVAGQTIGSIPLAPLEPFEGRAMEGILGYNFISRFVVEIDYANHVINLYDPKTFHYSGKGERVPLSFHGGLPVIHARISAPGQPDLNGVFTIDTGARNALTLARPFIEKTWLNDVAASGIKAPTGIGVGGISNERVARIGALTIGSVALKRVVTGLAFDKGGAFANPDFDGNIGGEVLRRFKVTFDYSRNEMFLEPNDRLDEPFEYDMLGALLMVTDKAFTVKVLVPGSPAAAADIREGDAIVAIDGTPSGDITLEQVRRTFRQDGKTVRLTVRRGADTREVTVTLKRIV